MLALPRFLLREDESPLPFPSLFAHSLTNCFACLGLNDVLIQYYIELIRSEFSFSVLAFVTTQSTDITLYVISRCHEASLIPEECYFELTCSSRPFNTN